MSSSENEEFESADEEYHESPKILRPSQQETKKVDVVETTRKENGESNKISNKNEKMDKTNDAIIDKSAVNKSVEKSEEKLKSSEDLTIKKEIKANPTDVSSKILDTEEEETIEDDVLENKDLDGWDVDDWPGDDNDFNEESNNSKETTSSKGKSKTSATSAPTPITVAAPVSTVTSITSVVHTTHAASAEAAEDEGDWSDFDDDWSADDDNNETSTAAAISIKNDQQQQQQNNINSIFPVLDKMSSDKNLSSPGQKSEGLLQNLSKFVNKTTTATSGRTSNYDTFPVLNEISTSKREYAFGSKSDKSEITTISSNEDTISKSKAQVAEIIESSSSSSWGWKPWGGVVSNILSTATSGVTTLTTHVSQGLSNVIESGMGMPDPAELARINKEKERLRGDSEDKSNNEDDNSPKQDEAILPGFDYIVSGVTQIGNKVITGGLDTLEGIGKKTMTILQENDPLLLNKRKMLGLEGEKPVLSQMLREAKEKSEEIERNLKQMHRNSYKKQLHFETLFDHYYGLVHLEALEMLSKQSTLKLQSLLDPLTGKALAELQETLNEVKELCDLGDLENEENDGQHSTEELTKKIESAVEDLGVQTDFKEIIKCWEDNVKWLIENEKSVEPQQVYEKGLRCLAETCALAIHRYHKIAEMLLIKDHHSTANEADSLVQLTIAFCWHLNGIANRFGSKLNTFEQNEETSSLITSIFVEVYNSNSYIQNAFQLFIPILQIGAA